MRGIIVSLAFVLAFPALAQSPSVSEQVLEAALNNVPHHFRSVGEPALWKLSNHQIAIASTTTGGGQEHLDRYLESAHAAFIAAELSKAYAKVSSSPAELGLDNVQGIPILSLAQFQTGSDSYDWQQLRQVYPEVGAVVRVSLPALDSSQSVGVVRYEVISPRGRGWSGFAQLTRDASGGWKDDEGRFGDLWD